ncbi:MAG: hypothetical protein ACFB14_18410 [Leptolyngbyaceae cyanobacterium]
MVFTSLSRWVRAVKALAVAFICAAALVVNSSPAFAFGMKTPAEPSEGTAQLDEVYQEAKQVTESQPRGMERVQDKATQGLNSVQGSADSDKMKSAGDSSEANTVKGDVKKAMKSAAE